MSECIFCRIAAGSAPSWKVYETDETLAFLDIQPASAYHTLVIPKRHYESAFDIPRDEFLRVMETVKHVVDLYADRLGIENLQIVSSSGREAQQDVFHAHVHVVPRRRGDGQDVVWTPRPELRERFDELLARLG